MFRTAYSTPEPSHNKIPSGDQKFMYLVVFGLENVDGDATTLALIKR